MEQEFVTLPREVVELAIEALFCTDSEEGSEAYKNELEAVKKLSAALKQPQDHIEQHLGMVPAGWRLVPVTPTPEMIRVMCAYDGTQYSNTFDSDDFKEDYRSMLAAAPQPPIRQQPQAKQEPVAWLFVDKNKPERMRLEFKSDDLKYDYDEGWLKFPLCLQSQLPPPPLEQEPVAWQSIEAMAVQRYKVVPAHDSMFYRHAVVAGDGTQQLYIGRETECENIARRFAGAFLDGAYEASLYTQPQNLSCKSNQARLATLWGYVKEQPPRQPLTDEEIADGLHFAIENATQYERAAFRKGIKFSERSHGIGTAASAPNPPALKQPQADQPAMTPIAQRKLEDLMASGYTISGYSVYHEQKHQHGFVTGAGLVGWWKPEGVEYPQPRGERELVRVCSFRDIRRSTARIG